MEVNHQNNEDEVCTPESVILFVKSQCFGVLPENEYSQALANDSRLSEIPSYFVSPIEFNFINIDLLEQYLRSPSDWSGVILTSTRCIDALVQAFNQMSETRNINIEEWSKLKILTVGPTTQRYLLEKLKFESIGHQSGNSKALADYILTLDANEFAGKPLLYPCSNIKTDSIEQTLVGRVKEITCYVTKPKPNIDHDLNEFNQFLDKFINSNECQNQLIVVFFSPSGVVATCKLINSMFASTLRLKLKFVAFGQLTAAKLIELGFQVWFTLEKPSPESLVSNLHLFIEKTVLPHREKLETWLNKNLKIKLSDDRVIMGVFLCTDCHCNIILGSSLEYLNDEMNEEPRVLGLTMIPGQHIVSIHYDKIVPS